MAYRDLRLEKRDGIAWLTLDRPNVLNALSSELLDELEQATVEIEADDSVRVVILSGAGRAFSAGRDVAEIAVKGARQVLQRSSGGHVFHRLALLPKPTIAAVHGPCFTGALELALACDIIIASEDASFGDTHARLGVIPGGGGTQRLPQRIGPHRAKQLLFTGLPITAGEAERIGLVNRVVPRERLLAEAEAIARAILEASPHSLATEKRLVNGDLEPRLAEETAAFANLWAHGDNPDIQSRFEKMLSRLKS
ncbi:MAG: enoyl-CoA hydratase/isomerase family protein [Chloroflexi bacterium]|nr:enoyl-CoA hydratase/isomerase family protein [Chloroflexota bacterium]